jgi:hypothetical protein
LQQVVVLVARALRELPVVLVVDGGMRHKEVHIPLLGKEYPDKDFRVEEIHILAVELLPVVAVELVRGVVIVQVKLVVMVEQVYNSQHLLVL